MTKKKVAQVVQDEPNLSEASASPVAVDSIITQADARLAQAELALEEIERALAVARENAIAATVRHQAACGLQMPGLPGPLGGCLAYDDPTREAIIQSKLIAEGEYHEQLAKVAPAQVAIRAAEAALKQAHQEPGRQSRHAWLVANDAEYRAILEQIALYEHQVRATDNSRDQRGNNLRARYSLKEAIAARDAKLNAA